MNWFSPNSSPRQIIKVKASDESVTSNTTLQNDDDLFFSIGANEVWAIDLTIYQSGAGGFKADMTVPSGATIKGRGIGLTSGFYDYIGLILGFGSSDYSSVGTGTYHLVVINGSTAGTVQYQWAQNTSNGTAAVVGAGSYLIATRLA